MVTTVLAAPAHGKVTASRDNESLEETEPTVTMTTTDSYLAQKILLFPFDLPAYAMRAVTWPIGAIIHVMEQKRFGERVFDLLSNKEKTFWVYPYIEGAPGPGFGGGMGFVHKDLFHTGWRISGRYDIRINMNQYARFAIRHDNLFRILDRRVSFRLDSTWSHENDDDYYGIGAWSTQSDHAKYRNDVIDGRIKLDWHITKPLGVGLRAGWWSGWTSSVAKGGYPGVSDQFSAAQLVGLGKTLNYFVPEIEAWYDTRDNFSFTNRGGRYSAGFARWQSVNVSNISYNQYDVELEHYIPLWRPSVVLMLRNKWVFKQRTGTSLVPFQLLSELDYNSPLRGFSRGRFHDRSSVLFNIEYRYPVWNVVYGVLFFDTGRVFRRLEDFDFSNFKIDGGGGFRLHFEDLALFSLDIGYGGEGVKLIFGIQKLL